MNQKPHRIVNSRNAVHSIVYPILAVEQRTPDIAKNEIMEVLPKRIIPGTSLLKKMAKEREKQKMKQYSSKVAEQAAEIYHDAVSIALFGIMADLEN